MVSTEQLERPEVVELLSELADAAPTITRLVRSVRALVDDGSMDLVAELLGFVRAMRDSAGPGMMSSVAAQGVKIGLMVDDLLASSWIDGLPAILEGIEAELTTRRDLTEKDQTATVWQVIRLARDPQTLRALHFLLSILKRSAGAVQPERAATGLRAV